MISKTATDISFPEPGQAWRHYKTLDLYTVIGVGHDEDGFPVVIYTAFTPTAGALFSRRLDSFLQVVDTDHGKVRRFTQERGMAGPSPYLNLKYWGSE